MSYTVEKDWESHGLRCVAILIEGRHRCGYVGVPKGNPLHGRSYSEHYDFLVAGLDAAMNGPVGKRGIIPIICSDGRKASPDIVFDVHGGITFADDLADYPVASDGLWWFGFDCAHLGDGSLSHPYGDDPVRSTEYVVSECESLARQIAEVAAWGYREEAMASREFVDYLWSQPGEVLLPIMDDDEVKALRARRKRYEAVRAANEAAERGGEG